MTAITSLFPVPLPAPSMVVAMRGGSARARVLPAPCRAAALAALGPVLCLYRSIDAHPLQGHIDARRACVQVRVGNDGPSEALRFFDAAGRHCWSLHLLPDSDCLAWEQLVSALEWAAPAASPWWAGEGWQAPIRWAFGSPRWQACALRLHCLTGNSVPDLLAASTPSLSPAGQRAAQRIAQTEGAKR